MDTANEKLVVPELVTLNPNSKLQKQSATEHIKISTAA